MSTATRKDLAELIEPGLLDQASNSAGYINFLEDDPNSTGPSQDLMLFKPLTLIYERWWRPVLGRVAKGAFGPSMADEHNIARLLLALKPGDRVLDIACGTGKFSRNFASVVGPKGFAAGLDVSRPMLERAVKENEKEGHDNLAFVRASASELPFKKQSFDAVCCFAALHLFPEPMKTLDEIVNVLAPEGRIALLIGVKSNTQPLRAVESRAGNISGLSMFDQSEIPDALASRGFTDIRQRLAGAAQFIGGRLPG